MTQATKPLARIAKLSAAFVSSNLMRAAIGFGLALAIGRALGAERFGRWILCTTWASMLTVAVDLGFGVLLTRDGARDDAEPGRLLAGALLWRMAIAVPLAAVLVASAPIISADPEALAGLRAGALLGLLGAAYGCFGALFRSQPQWVPAILGVETAWLAAQLLAAWWIVANGGGVVALVTLASGVQLAQIASAIALWPRAFGSMAFSVPSRRALVEMLHRAIPFAASGIVANLQTRIAPLMLGYLSTDAELGWFGAASRVGGVARLAPQAIFAGALPVLSNEYGRDRAGARKAFHTFDRALLLFTVAPAAACILVAAPLMRVVFGSGFAGAGASLVWIAIALVPALMNSSRKIFLYASGGETTAVRWSTVALIVQAVSGALLMPAFGSVGAAASVLVAEAAIWLPLRRAIRSPERGHDRPIATTATEVTEVTV